MNHVPLRQNPGIGEYLSYTWEQFQLNNPELVLYLHPSTRLRNYLGCVIDKQVLDY